MSQNTATARQLLIDGKWVDPIEGGTIASYDPSTGELLANLAAAGPKDVEAAVQAARRAFDDGPWRTMPAEARARILHRFADLIEEHADEIALIDTQDCGKPYAFIRDVDLPNMADLVRYMAGWTTKLEGRTIPLSRQVRRTSSPTLAGNRSAWSLRSSRGTVQHSQAYGSWHQPSQPVAQLCSSLQSWRLWRP